MKIKSGQGSQKICVKFHLAFSCIAYRHSTQPFENRLAGSETRFSVVDLGVKTESLREKSIQTSLGIHFSKFFRKICSASLFRENKVLFNTEEEKILQAALVSPDTD